MLYRNNKQKYKIFFKIGKLDLYPILSLIIASKYSKNDIN